MMWGIRHINFICSHKTLIELKKPASSRLLVTVHPHKTCTATRHSVLHLSYTAWEWQEKADFAFVTPEVRPVPFYSSVHRYQRFWTDLLPSDLNPKYTLRPKPQTSCCFLLWRCNCMQNLHIQIPQHQEIKTAELLVSNETQRPKHIFLFPAVPAGRYLPTEQRACCSCCLFSFQFPCTVWHEVPCHIQKFKFLQWCWWQCLC